MTSLGWFLVTVGLVVWAVGARGFVTDELVEFLRGGPPEAGPTKGVGRVRPMTKSTSSASPLNISPDKDRCFFLRCYRNPD